jgi:hypothetical protein
VVIMKSIRATLRIYLLLMCCSLPMMAQNAAGAESVVPGVVKFSGALNDGNRKPLTEVLGRDQLSMRRWSLETANKHAGKPPSFLPEWADNPVFGLE